MFALTGRFAAFLLILLLAGSMTGCSINESDAEAGPEEPTPDGDTSKCDPDSSQSTGEITLSGQITYDRVPANSDFTGLDYSATTQKPVRQVRISAVCGTETFANGATDASGNYSLEVPNNTDLILRVRAYLADYEFKVVDNTNNDALYVLDSDIINADTNQTVNLNAASGWTGNGYTEPRAAAPFAILDSALTAALKISNVDTDAVFPSLELNWSPNNVPSGGVISEGQIGTTFYQRTAQGSEIYVLGAAGDDTDEYDDHVIIHEWGHYFDDRFSRLDSIGGQHSGDSKLDMRVAYGEGFGNAWSAIATDDPIYFDTMFADQDGGMWFNLESSESLESEGWYSETSVQRLLWDFYDQSNGLNEPDAADIMGLGLVPLYDVLVTEQKNTPAFTSIYSFAWALHADQSAEPTTQSWIVSLLEGHNIFGDNIWGENETNSPDITTTPEDDGLPVYQTAMIDGATPDACSDREYGESNKSTNRQFYHIQPQLRPVEVEITVALTATSEPDAEPDFRLYQSGVLQSLECTKAEQSSTCGIQETPNGTEKATASLEAEKSYLLVIYDYYNVDGDLTVDDNDNQIDGRSCFSVSLISK